MMQDLGLSERRACRLTSAPRSTVRYQSVEPRDHDLRQRMRDLSDRHRRFGHPRLHVLLRREGFGANHKKTHRIYVEEGLYCILAVIHSHRLYFLWFCQVV